jgi:uncharacterized protein YkwD
MTRQATPSADAGPARQLLPGFLLVWLLLAIPGAAAAPADSAARVDGARGCKDAGKATRSTARLEGALVCLHNRERRRRGLSPLRASRALRTAAGRHARDMVRRNYFSHVSPDGRTLTDRVAATGYTRGGSFALGENILFNGARLPSPRDLMRQWLASPGHRANILRGTWREVGLASARDSPLGGGGGVTVVAVFGARY